MTTEGKLVKIAENEHKVYEAGKKAIVKLHPEATVSGSYISLDDVSELPHEVKCKISGVADPTTVKVTGCGKNLATAQQVWAGSDNYKELVEDGRNAIRFIGSKNVQNVLPIFEENTQYTFSFDTKAVLTNSSNAGKTDAILCVFYTDGTNLRLYFHPHKNEESVWEKRTLTTTEGKTVQSVGTVSYGYFHWLYVDVDTFQIEKGTTVTEYEPYKGQTIAPNTDGIVEGMTSVSPFMNIFTDTEGANIEATYRKSKGMEVEKEQFYNNFKTGYITDSISFEWMTGLGRTNTALIVGGLSDKATGQTLTLNLAGVNKAYETSSGANDGSTSAAFAELVATKPNWTITLI